MEIDQEKLREIIEKLTDDKIDDSKADKDTLESIVSYILFGVDNWYVDADAFIKSTRKNYINRKKQGDNHA